MAALEAAEEQLLQCNAKQAVCIALSKASKITVCIINAVHVERDGFQRCFDLDGHFEHQVSIGMS